MAATTRALTPSRCNAIRSDALGGAAAPCARTWLTIRFSSTPALLIAIISSTATGCAGIGLPKCCAISARLRASISSNSLPIAAPLTAPTPAPMAAPAPALPTALPTKAPVPAPRSPPNKAPWSDRYGDAQPENIANPSASHMPPHTANRRASTKARRRTTQNSDEQPRLCGKKGMTIFLSALGRRTELPPNAL